MVPGDRQRAWREDAEVAGLLLESWESSMDSVTMRVPNAVAERAVEAWERSDETEDEVTGLSAADDLVRRASGTLALVGAALAGRARWDDAAATVDLSPAVVCELVRTSDGMDSLKGG